jgi:hypothetical protein
LDGSVLYPTWLSARVTMRWGTLKPARAASLGGGKESVSPNARGRVATKMIASAAAPRTSPNRRRDRLRRPNRSVLTPRTFELEAGPATGDARRGPRGPAASTRRADVE